MPVDCSRDLTLLKGAMTMRLILTIAGLLASVGIVRADELNLHVILSGQVVPGVYGQVQLGSPPPPPLVYARPLMIERPAAPPPPVYLHVPPGHAKNWRKHCHEYNACNRPVYFVRSKEYEPNYRREDDRGPGHGNGHGHGHGHGNDDHDDHHHDD